MNLLFILFLSIKFKLNNYFYYLLILNIPEFNINKYYFPQS